MKRMRRVIRGCTDDNLTSCARADYICSTTPDFTGYPTIRIQVASGYGTSRWLDATPERYFEYVTEIAHDQVCSTKCGSGVTSCWLLGFQDLPDNGNQFIIGTDKLRDYYVTYDPVGPTSNEAYITYAKPDRVVGGCNDSDACGDQASSGCWCDSKCQLNIDCCADFYSECGATVSHNGCFSAGCGTDGSISHCRLVDNAYTDGFCDELCTYYGDCCDDFDDLCAF